MAGIKRKKFKELSTVINIADVKTVAEVEASFGVDRHEVTITGGSAIKHKEMRLMRPLFGQAFRNELHPVNEDDVWDFIFEHFIIEGKEFEQSAWNLGNVCNAIWTEVYDRLQTNKKK